VVVDPTVAFGLPLVVHGGARVEDLVDRFQAGDSGADIAADFSVPGGEVEDVIRFGEPRSIQTGRIMRQLRRILIRSGVCPASQAPSSSRPISRFPRSS